MTTKYYHEINKTEWGENLVHLMQFEEKELNWYTDAWIQKCLIFKDSKVFDLLIPEYELQKIDKFLLDFSISDKRNLDWIEFTKNKVKEVSNLHKGIINRHDKFKKGEYFELVQIFRKKNGRDSFYNQEIQIQNKPPFINYEIKIKAPMPLRGKPQKWQVYFFKDSEDWFWVRSTRWDYPFRAPLVDFFCCDGFSGFLKYLEHTATEYFTC